MNLVRGYAEHTTVIDFFSIFGKKRKGTTFVFIKEMQQNVISQGKIEFQQKFENAFVVGGKRKSTELQKKLSN